ncbi:N-acyl-D-amino-acid deacylase family protein [Anaerosporobacter sp.]|uniref:N-acyl-D-amino-acid deacylase family protein n=1 Tax=Anaerosporobacter sp. TaxID=1872529 RepID=UPI00286F7B51|nr:amidohydrolase family protein [Anaerosporobacter sp.]
MRTLLKNGKIYDGTGNEPFISDILIENDKISKIASEIPSDSLQENDICYDLNGLSVSPGFIDAHSHNDWFAIKNEPQKYFEPFIRQGITTFVTGNCGLSSVGFEPDSQYVDKLGGGLFFFNDTTGRYGSVDEYFESINQNTPCNIATLIGHCSARASVAGMENRPLTKEEETKMLSILEKALQQGAAGISLGLMYEPGLYADTTELKKVAALCTKYDRPLTVHARACSAVSMSYPELLGRSHLLRALDELAEIARETKVKLHYSHAIFVGRRSFKDKGKFLDIIHNLKNDGIDVQFDIYDEKLGVSVITVILPSWYQSMTPKEKKNPINKIKLSILCKASSILLGFGFDDIVVAYLGEGYEQYHGKTVHQIAKELKTSDLKAYLHLCEISNFNGRVNMGPYSTDEIISELCKDDSCLYMTDAWVEDFGVQNPAIYDCFPKFLMHSLKGSGDTMPNTIRKMTGATADRFNLPERGYLRSNYFADITIFDESKLQNGTPDIEQPFGIEKVFIGGKLILDQNAINETVLKSAGAAVKVR